MTVNRCSNKAKECVRVRERTNLHVVRARVAVGEEDPNEIDGGGERHKVKGWTQMSEQMSDSVESSAQLQ